MLPVLFHLNRGKRPDPYLCIEISYWYSCYRWVSYFYGTQLPKHNISFTGKRIQRGNMLFLTLVYIIMNDWGTRLNLFSQLFCFLLRSKSLHLLADFCCCILQSRLCWFELCVCLQICNCPLQMLVCSDSCLCDADSSWSLSISVSIFIEFLWEGKSENPFGQSIFVRSKNAT